MLKLLLLLNISVFAFGVVFAQDSSVVVNDSIYDVVEVEPEFPGGMVVMTQFIHENMHYPPVDCVQSVIYIRFIVEKDGAITPRKATEGGSSPCDIETARLISIMPKWSPGYVSGQPVRVAFTIPLYVHLR